MATRTRKKKSRDYLTLQQFQQWLIDNDIKTIREFQALKDSRPHNIPSNPVRCYGHSWYGITGRKKNDATKPRKVYVEYADYLKWLQDNDLHTIRAAQALRRETKAKGIASDPVKIYNRSWEDIVAEAHAANNDEEE